MASTVDSNRVQEYNEEDTPEFEKKMDILASMVKKSKYTVFYTGAGVSTSAGVGDYRGPSGAWTNRKIKELEANFHRTPEEEKELINLKKEKEKEIQKANKKVDMNDAQPTLTHMAQATMIRLGIAHFVVTTNLDGIYRKAGLKGHEQLCCLHGDIYVERCTSCGYDFERNYHTRKDFIHVHDHSLGDCSRCGSKVPPHYTGSPGDLKMKQSQWGGRMVGTRDVNCGTKDTHINFGEFLDSVDWHEAELHCGQADLVIIAGTSMSLRHITHFPFMAKKVVLINLQATPDDEQADLRIWAKCDPVFEALCNRLNITIDPIPVWRPRDSVPINMIPSYVNKYYIEKAKDLEEMAKFREQEEEDRRLQLMTEQIKALKLNDAQIEVGNYHVKIDPTYKDDRNVHKWTMAVRLPASLSKQGYRTLDFVESVEYTLHPTFSPNVIKVGSPFQLERRGWGTFPVGVEITLKPRFKAPVLNLEHHLNFTNDETFQLCKFN
jgi:NAD-dependent SIR2 family protein deacetylase